jgi:hypothetical protein
MDGRDIASAWTIRRGHSPWHVQTLLTREPGDLTGVRKHSNDSRRNRCRGGHCLCRSPLTSISNGDCNVRVGGCQCNRLYHPVPFWNYCLPAFVYLWTACLAREENIKRERCHEEVAWCCCDYWCGLSCRSKYCQRNITDRSGFRWFVSPEHRAAGGPQAVPPLPWPALGSPLPRWRALLPRRPRPLARP